MSLFPLKTKTQLLNTLSGFEWFCHLQQVFTFSMMGPYNRFGTLQND